MSPAITPKNIQRNINLMFPDRSLNYRRSTMVEHIVALCPTITVLSLQKKYLHTHIKKKDSVIHEMVVAYLEEIKHGPILTQDDVKESDKLAKFIFRYYRHMFSDALKSEDTILLHEAFDLVLLVNKNPNYIPYKRWINLMVASTQAGKTFIVIALSHIFIALGYDSIFILKDTSQITQFLSRYLVYSTKLQSALKGAGFSKQNIDMFGEPLYHDSSMSKSHHDNFLRNVGLTLNRTQRRSILCIHNSIHLERVYNQITPHSNFILFVDEAHKLGAYKQMTDNTEKTLKNGSPEDCYDQMYINLKVFAQKIFLITATPQVVLITEPALYSDSIVTFPEGKDYRGIETCKFELLPSTKEEIYINIEGIGYGGPVKSSIPLSFFKTVAKLSGMKPIKRINRFGVKDKLPIALIAKFEVTNDGQKILFDAMKPDAKALNDDHQKIINAKWCSIIFNMYGIRMYDNSLQGATISIKTFEGTSKENTLTYVDKDGSGEFLFPREHVQIEDVLHWMWLNGGHKRFPRIVVLTYKSAEEGITFSSKWAETTETCANWHFPFMYSRMGDSVSTANKEQASGRVNGNHGDFDLNGQPLMCTHWDTLVGKEKLIKGVNLHRQMIKDLCQLKFEANDGLVINHVNGYEMFANRVPKQYYGDITGAQSTIKKIKNPHADIENESFTRHKSVLSTLQMINPDEYDGDKRRKRNIDRVEEETPILDLKSSCKAKNTTGKYKIIDENIFGTKTKVYKMIKDVQSILIEETKTAIDVPIDWITKALKSTKYRDLSLNDIHGCIWTQIRKSKHFTQTDIIPNNSLVYHTININNKDTVCVRLTY